ncbi:hypothetical protein C8Q79DRAFT_529566 [Trametes meyenii]|nr:hypothetical protein C8Q79DRAFT_529566 [Trametes meyenii]
MFTPIMNVVSLILAFVVGLSIAKPLYLADRDAVSPPITNPTAKAVWRVGETQTITWDVAALNGATPSNPLAKIILGTLTADGQERLMFETPLVSGFPILGGNVSLTVPSVPPADNYIVCLFGTADDISAAFSIVGGDASSTSAPATSDSAAPTSSATIPSTADDAASRTATHPKTEPTVGSATQPASSSASTPASETAASSAATNASSSSAAVSGSGTSSTSGFPSSVTTTTTAAGTSGARSSSIAHAQYWGALCVMWLAYTFF